MDMDIDFTEPQGDYEMEEDASDMETEDYPAEEWPIDDQEDEGQGAINWQKELI